MNNKKLIPLWLSVILVVLVLGTVVICVSKTMDNSTPKDYLSCIFICASCAFSLYYFFGGYQKDSADHFQWFNLCFMMSNFLSIILRALGDAEYLTLIGPSISYGVMCVMCIGKNLGKSKTYLLWAVLMIANIFDVAIHMFFDNTGLVFSFVGAKLILSIAYGIMIYAKYADKENRGTK